MATRGYGRAWICRVSLTKKRRPRFDPLVYLALGAAS